MKDYKGNIFQGTAEGEKGVAEWAQSTVGRLFFPVGAPDSLPVKKPGRSRKGVLKGLYCEKKGEPGYEAEDQYKELVKPQKEVHGNAEDFSVQGKPPIVQGVNSVAGKDIDGKHDPKKQVVKERAPEKEPAEGADIHGITSFILT